MSDRLVRRKIYGGCRTFCRSKEKRLKHSCDRFTEPRLPVDPHVGGHRSGMTAVYGYPPALQPLCQFSGEKNVRKLALRICLDHVVAAVKIDIVKMNLPHLVRPGSNIYYSGTGRHAVKQQRREQKMAKVVDSKLALYAVLCLLSGQGDEACVIDEDVHSRVLLLHLAGEATDRSEISEVTQHEV